MPGTEQKLELVRRLEESGLYRVPFEPGGYRLAIIDESVTCEAFFAVPENQISMYAYRYTERESEGLWMMVLWQRKALDQAIAKLAGNREAGGEEEVECQAFI